MAFQFKRDEISIGQVLTALSAIIAVGVAFGVVQNTQITQARELQEVKQEINRQRLDRITLEARLSTIETKVDSIDNTVSAIFDIVAGPIDRDALLRLYGPYGPVPANTTVATSD